MYITMKGLELISGKISVVCSEMFCDFGCDEVGDDED